MSSPYMNLFVADYLGDTQHLTTEQHGAYLLLLMTMWRNGGRLPNDPVKLARIARVSPRRWHLFSDVMAFFTPLDDGTVTQKRLEREHQKALSISEKRSASADAGNRAKALKNNEPSLANASVLRGDTRAGLPEPYPEKEEVASPSIPLPEPDNQTSPSAPQPGGGASNVLRLIQPPEPELPVPIPKGRYPEQFEELWREYLPVAAPNATKADAYAAWKRLSSADRDACWQGTISYVMWVFGERKRRPDCPVKHLATFINRRGWEPFMDAATASAEAMSWRQ